MLMMIIVWGFAIVYFFLQLQYIYHWNRFPAFHPVPLAPSIIPVTVILIARNEAKHIKACLDGLLNQSYPASLTEIIVVDDHSTDDTLEILKSIRDDRIQVYRLEDFPEFIHAPAYKKSAITLAVDKASHHLLVVTDADCVHSPVWLQTIVQHFQKTNCVFQTAPVLVLEGKSMLEKMQDVELMVYALITGAGIKSNLHVMANGANMAFSKQAFESVKGYEGNYHYPSGDDMFLAEKMKLAFPDRIQLVKSKEACVYTHSKPDWSSLLQQRMRWASKNSGLESKRIANIWFFVGLYHGLLILLLFLGIFQIKSIWPFFILLLAKWMADFMVIQNAAAFFNKRSLLRHFIPLQILFTIYLVRLFFYMISNKNKTDWNLQRKQV